MSSRPWVISSLMSLPEIFCWVFSGRTPRSLMLLVGHTRVSSEPQHVVLAGMAELQQVAAGCWAVVFFGPGDAGHVGQAGKDRVTELADQRVPHVHGNLGPALLAAACQARIRPCSARCAWPGQIASGQHWAAYSKSRIK